MPLKSQRAVRVGAERQSGRCKRHEAQLRPAPPYRLPEHPRPCWFRETPCLGCGSKVPRFGRVRGQVLSQAAPSSALRGMSKLSLDLLCEAAAAVANGHNQGSKRSPPDAEHSVVLSWGVKRRRSGPMVRPKAEARLRHALSMRPTDMDMTSSACPALPQVPMVIYRQAGPQQAAAPRSSISFLPPGLTCRTPRSTIAPLAAASPHPSAARETAHLTSRAPLAGRVLSKQHRTDASTPDSCASDSHSLPGIPLCSPAATMAASSGHTTHSTLRGLPGNLPMMLQSSGLERQLTRCSWPSAPGGAQSPVLLHSQQAVPLSATAWQRGPAQPTSVAGPGDDMVAHIASSCCVLPGRPV